MTNIISNTVTVICKSQELYLMCLVLCTFHSPSSCHTVSTTCPQCFQTCTPSWTCCILHISSQSSAAYCLGEISCLAQFPGTYKKKVITIPFIPTRPMNNNAASIFHKFSNPLSYLCISYSHCLLLLPLMPSLSASFCSFHSITLSFTLHADL